MKITIDYKSKEVVLRVPIVDPPVASSTGNTEALVNIKNQMTELKYTDGRPIKVSLLVYVKPLVAPVSRE